MFSRFLFTAFIGTVLFLAGAREADAAILKLQPSSGTFIVGSILNVALTLDTEGEYINAVEAFLTFPPDKFQLVSPMTGKSVIEIWTSQPRFNNRTGVIELRGGIPNGLNASDGLVTTLRFRVKSTGSAVVKFTDRSRIFLNDGRGTEVLRDTQSAVYRLALPPPAGPIVASETHQDQSAWYASPTVVLNWASDFETEGYSYVLNAEPIDIPDDTSEGVKTGVAYRNLSDGVHFFHIKALRNGAWGGTTHFAVQLDTKPPAEFPITIIPSDRTTERQPIIRYVTTDEHSGIDVERYELKIVPLEDVEGLDEGTYAFFIEAESPYTPSRLPVGRYDVIVRAYDKAGNFTEVSKRFRIVSPMLQFAAEKGLVIRDALIIPWIALWTILFILIVLAALTAWWLRRWHSAVEERRRKQELPTPVKEQLEELQKYRARYGKIAVLLLVLGQLLLFGHPVSAQELEFGPPFVTAVSRNISNEEIFYVGGKAEAAGIDIIIYLQNLRTGETLSQTVSSDAQGDWFYRHDAFLSSGDYLLWTQSKIGEQESPPSPQIRLTIRPTAIQFGASRVSFETLYLSISVFLFLALAAVLIYLFVHARRARRKHKEFMKEVREAEESVRRGFAVLKRDIEAELAIIKSAKLSKELSAEERVREEQLMRDLKWAEQYIGREVWDIRETEHGG